jgi:hypothetical protein
VLVLSLQEAEVALIGPPLPEMPSKQNSGYDLTVTTDDDMTINTLTEADSEPKLNQFTQQNTEDSALGTSFNSNQQNPNDSTKPPDHSLDNGVISSTLLNGNMPGGHSSDITLNSSTDPENPVTRGHRSASDSPQIFITDPSHHHSGTVSDTMLADTTPATTTPGGGNTPLGWSPSRGSNVAANKKQQADIKKSFNSAFNSLQRGLGSSVSKFSEKVSKMSLEDGSEDWDTTSVRSGSDEDEDYILQR